MSSHTSRPPVLTNPRTCSAQPILPPGVRSADPDARPHESESLLRQNRLASGWNDPGELSLSSARIRRVPTLPSGYEPPRPPVLDEVSICRSNHYLRHYELMRTQVLSRDAVAAYLEKADAEDSEPRLPVAVPGSHDDALGEPLLGIGPRRTMEWLMTSGLTLMAVALFGWLISTLPAVSPSEISKSVQVLMTPALR